MVYVWYICLVYTLWVNDYITMENHHFEWVNQLTKWQFSIAMLVCQRVKGVARLFFVIFRRIGWVDSYEGETWIDGLKSIRSGQQIITGWWFGTWFFFPSIGNVIIPTDFHSIIFQRGRYTGIPPTRLWLFEDFPILIFQHKVPSWQALMRATKNCWKRLQVHRKAWLKFSPFLKQVIDTRDTSWWKRSFSGHVCWGQELL